MRKGKPLGLLLEELEASDPFVRAAAEKLELAKRKILEEPPHRAFVGLDLSLRRPGFCFLLPGWRPQDPWQGVRVEAVDEVKDAGSERLLRITRAVERFIVAVWLSGEHPRAPAVFVEQHAFGMAKGSYALERAELVGAVKVMVREHWEVETIPIVASSARKLLFGPVKRVQVSKENGGWKPFIEAGLREMGAPEEWGEDERDAFCIANAGRHLLGLPCLAYG